MNEMNNIKKGVISMNTHTKILRAVQFICSALVILGIFLFTLGIIVSDYNYLVGIGVGAAISAAFIWLMGVFLVATEEMIMGQKNI